MTRQIILDTETTGLSPEEGHRIIEVGCLEMINRRITGNNLHIYINPERAIDRGAEEVHGITNEFLRDKPKFRDVAQQIIDYIQGAELIIHNAPFDVGFLDHEFFLARTRVKTEKICTVTDSLRLARTKHPGQRNSLDALCSRYGVDNSNRDLHGALLDAELLAQVYLIMTGGQTKLFAHDDNSSAAESAQTIRRVPADYTKTPIIKASTAECAEHARFVEQL